MTFGVSVACTRAEIIRKSRQQSVYVPGVSTALYEAIYDTTLSYFRNPCVQFCLGFKQKNPK